MSINLSASRMSAEKREVSRKDSVKSLRRKIRGEESHSTSLYGDRSFRDKDCQVQTFNINTFFSPEDLLIRGTLEVQMSHMLCVRHKRLKN